MNQFVPKNAFGVLMKNQKRQHQMFKENQQYKEHQAKVKKQKRLWKTQQPKKKRSSWKRRVHTHDASTVPICKQIPTKPRPIVVDGFQYANSTLSSIYFLSHFHSDHYIGLTKSFNAGLIFCSEKTKQLVQLRLKVPAHLVISLPLNVPVSLAQYDMHLSLKSVTLLHANHTPDGCTFIFLLNNGQIHWHTGDFRYLPTMVTQNVLLNKSADYIKTTTGKTRHPTLSVHTLYLDTTYCNPRYDLPKQTTAVNAVIAWIVAIKQQQRNDVAGSSIYLFGTYTIGKEKVFRGVSTHFNQRVVVLDTSKKNILNIVMDDFDDVVESNSSNMTINHDLFVVGMGELSYDKILDSVLAINRLRSKHCGGKPPKITKVFGFKPTGWCHSSASSSSSSKQQQTLPWGETSRTSAPALNLPVRKRKICGVDVTIVSVPYSEHSSFPELKECVKTIGAKRILPTVGAYSQRDGMVKMLTN